MTRNRLLNPAASVAVALLSLAALAGCAPEPTAPTGESTTGSSGAPSDTPAEPDGDCLVGDWVISQEALQGFYDAVSENSGGVSFVVEGGTGLSFTESNYNYTPDLVLNLDVAGMPAEGALAGSISGEYSTADNVITTVHDESDVDFTITMNGTTTDGAEIFGAFLTEAPINNAAYSCTATGPVIEFGVGADATTPVQLTAAG